MFELTTVLAQQSTPVDLIRTAWEVSAKNTAAIAYVRGMVDALFWMGVIDERDAAAFYQMTEEV